jgi:hypothetical protein
MDVEEYARRGHKRIHGWLRPEAATLIARLAKSQTIVGNVGEIGVHHGKLFLLLHLLRREGERSVAVDLFEQQHLNIDRSGRGDRAVFERNLAMIAGAANDVIIASADSTTLSTDNLLKLGGGPFRLFSIDGGHTADITENDLTIASEALADGGLLILDDYFNERWPAVSEGTNRFLSQGPRVQPIGSGHGKTFLTTPAYAELYRHHMSESARENNWKSSTQQFFGHDHVTVWSTAPQGALLRAAKNTIRAAPRLDRLLKLRRT